MKRRVPAIDPEALAAEIAGLSKIGTEELRERWKTIYGRAPSREIGPRRTRCDRAIADPHRTNAAGVHWTESAVAVAKQVTRRFVPGKRVGHLAGDPLGGPVVRHADAHQSSAGVTKNDQAVEQLERDRPNHEQIQ